MSWRPVAWLLASALAGCGGERAEAPPPAPSIAQPAPAAPPDAGSARADRVVQRALKEMARVRKLSAKRPVSGELISRDEMVAHIREQIRTEVPPKVVEAQATMLFALGVVPDDFDYIAAILQLMGSELAGFYEPRNETMYLAADLGKPEREATLAHELVHALQDQHYDLGERVRYREDATDEQSAVHALAEGDATSAMMDQMLRPRGITALDLPDELISLEARGAIELTPETASVPSIIKRSLISPYVDGLELVHWLRRRGGWAKVDAIWSNPPTTTEQVLHPEKLVAREPAEPIEIPAGSAVGAPSYHDVLGEQSLRLLFEEWMPRRTAESAASHWAGDRLAVFGDARRQVVAWHLRYDDEEAAEAGLVAMARGALSVELEKRPPKSLGVGAKEAREALAGKGAVCRTRKLRGAFAVVRDARDLGVVLGPFLRNSSAERADGSCADALAWARQIARQGR